MGSKRAPREDLPRALQSDLVFGGPNEPCVLFEGEMTLAGKSGGPPHASSAGSIFLGWLPTPAVRFAMEDRGLYIEPGDQLVLTTPEVGSAEVSVTRFSPGVECRGRLWDLPPRGDLDHTTEVLFELPNFLDLHGAAVWDASNQSVRPARVKLEAAPWEVVIDKLTTADDDIKVLKQDGGFAVTHTGVFRRMDHGSFTWSQARQFAETLFFFLSFMRGLWCGPMLLRGMQEGSPSWTHWRVPKLSSWRGVSSWVPTVEPAQELKELSRAFGKFCVLRSHPVWSEALIHAIHWLVEANLDAGGAPGGVIMTQAALEALSWAYLVESEATRQMSARGFKKLGGAAERLRRLLSEMSIPATIPKDTDDVQGAADLFDVKDSPGLIVALRNALVHPRRADRQRLREVGDQPLFAGRRIALHLLELSILRVLDYRGLFYSRLRTGYPSDVRERVPWVRG